MATGGEDGATATFGEEYRKECSHYSRGCSFVSPCCGKVYPCRLCHDDAEFSHQINRHTVAEIICRKCSKRQPVCGSCVDCGIGFGRYFCVVCRLYDDADKGQFHCEKCGLCRVGGKDNYFHCDTCGMCLSLSVRETHTCRRQNSKNNCPVCMEDIHTSRTAAHVPKCGHLIHTTCYQEMMRKGLYQCPQCQTSLPDMSSQWRQMDTEREAWALPQHLQNFKVKVNCRDCHKESETNFHVIGFKCSECGSYNTVRCGNEEMPPDPQPRQGGLVGLIRRLAARGNQRQGDEESDSSSSSHESGDSDNSDNDDSDHEEGGGNLGHHDNQQPDLEDRGHHHGDGSNKEQNEDVPSNQPHDYGEVDDDSYDGDESDNDDEFDSVSSGEFFFDCSNRFELWAPSIHPVQSVRQPIRSQTMPQWWESDGEEDRVQCTRSHSSNAATYPPSRDHHHGNKCLRKPHPPIQITVEQLNVMDIWGSDYFTDSFSEVSSSEISSCEDDSVVGGRPYPQQRPDSKKDPRANNTPGLAVNFNTNKPQGPQSLTRLYSEAPSLTYPIQNGLNRESSCAYIQAQNGHPVSKLCSVDSHETVKDTLPSTKDGLVHDENWNALDPATWVRKSSSEESWVTANEDWAVGTLV